MNYLQDSFLSCNLLFIGLTLIFKFFPLCIILTDEIRKGRETRITKFRHKLGCRITHSSCSYCSCVFSKTQVTGLRMCAVWCSRINSTCTQVPDESNIIETGVMSQGEGVDLFVPTSGCLCNQSGAGASILLLT